ncbi:c-type cytochrome [Virgifigura deserti]|uniref:SorU family sulfite dehydrogenase c-type cytochrome subunit n=1 Tax=Virgifigura deserti TaxID=2268457 RepID=UPI003CCC136E
MPQPARMRTRCARFLLSAMLALSPLAAHAQDAAGEERGKQVFTTAEPPCSLCHTLADAGATGNIGPNLDELKPTEGQVRAAVSGGVGVMPAYGGTLSEEQIAAVAEYVATVAGQAK